MAAQREDQRQRVAHQAGADNRDICHALLLLRFAAVRAAAVPG